MDAATALRHIRGCATANRIRILRHAWVRGASEGRSTRTCVTPAGARACEAANQDRWKVFGDDQDGDELIVVVFIEAGVVVVTVY